MKTENLIGALFLAAAMVGAPAMAQDVKIGAINLAKLVAESPQAAQARASMKERFADRRDDLKAQQKALQDDAKRLQRDGAVMSADARDSLQASIRDQQRHLKLAQDEYNDKVNQAEQDALQALRAKVRDVINRYADEHGYDLILGTGVLYAKGAVDITDEVLGMMKGS
ncbi:MAG: OmpH family outer membrane protein [Salinisphaera sp.]|nr:OmpH family outer membrane protein [Salinisphaera sp.]